MEERRRFHRFRHAEAVHFQWKDPRYFGGCLSCDLSEGGIRFHSDDFIPLNTPLTLQIQLAGDRVADCMGHVVWVEKERFADRYQVGLEFAGGSPYQLQNMLCERSKEGG